MPYMKNGKRDYARELTWEHTRKKNRVKDRAQRNSARAMVARKAGKRATALKEDVGHRRAISKGGSNYLGNLFLQSPSKNRSFSRTKRGAMKSETSTRERGRR
jgi:hypothetical protein